jgi:hypothetical protein
MHFAVNRKDERRLDLRLVSNLPGGAGRDRGGHGF